MPSQKYCIFLSTVELDPVSAAIRFATKCDWSHIGFYRLSDSYTFSAMSDGKGVDWRAPNPRCKILLLDLTNDPSGSIMEGALAIAEGQQGDHYDFLDILGIALGGNWETPGRMICDKLVLYAFQQLTLPLLNMTFIPIEHFTPRDILLSPYVIQRT